MFDLDGTLVDSVIDIAISTNAMLLTHGKAPFPLENYRQWMGDGATVMLQRALSGSIEINPDVSPKQLEQAKSFFFDFYRRNTCVGTSLYPAVSSTLASLQQKGYIMAVVSNKPVEYIEPILTALDIQTYFALSYGGDSFEHKKPHPQQLLACCDQFNCKPNQAVMIGDSKNDVLAAKAAGIDSIAVSYGYNFGEDINRYQPDFTCDHFHQLLNLL